MEPIRVVLSISPDHIGPHPASEELVGKTGTIVFADVSAWGELMVDVELDVPHSLYGPFAQCAYVTAAPNRMLYDIATPVEPASVEDVRRLARLINGNWRRYRAPGGDPMPWSQVAPLLEEDQACLEKDGTGGE